MARSRETTLCITFSDPVGCHWWFGFKVRVLLKDIPLRSRYHLAGFRVGDIDPVTGGVGFVPLHVSGLAFFFRLAYEDVPKAVVWLAVAVVQSGHQPRELIVRCELVQF